MNAFTAHLVCYRKTHARCCERRPAKDRIESGAMPNHLIIIEHFPNERVREFRFNSPISTGHLYGFSGADALDELARGWLASSTIQAAQSFCEIEGVTGVSLDVNLVRITIDCDSSWNDITPQVVRCIRRHLCWEYAEIRDHDSRPAYSPGAGLLSFADDE